MNSEFGMITLARSKVSISVARTRTRRTHPSSPLTTIESPTRIGRSVSRMRPDTKFDTMDCSPNPIPTESAPAINVIFQVEAEPRERNHDRDDRADIAEDRNDRELKTLLQPGPRQQLRFQPALYNARDDEQQQKDNSGRQQRLKR